MVCATVRLTQSGTKAIAYAVMNSHTEDAVLSNAAEVYAMCGVRKVYVASEPSRLHTGRLELGYKR